jgi:hypothetical protein
MHLFRSEILSFHRRCSRRAVTVWKGLCAKRCRVRVTTFPSTFFTFSKNPFCSLLLFFISNLSTFHLLIQVFAAAALFNVAKEAPIVLLSIVEYEGISCIQCEDLIWSKDEILRPQTMETGSEIKSIYADYAAIISSFHPSFVLWPMACGGKKNFMHALRVFYSTVHTLLRACGATNNVLFNMYILNSPLHCRFYNMD